MVLLLLGFTIVFHKLARKHSMYFRITPNSDITLDIAEERLNTHGYFANQEYIERVQ